MGLLNVAFVLYHLVEIYLVNRANFVTSLFYFIIHDIHEKPQQSLTFQSQSYFALIYIGYYMSAHV